MRAVRHTLGLLLLLAAAAQAQDAAALERARKVEQDVVDLVQRVSQAFVMIGGGSGIIISPDGDVLTNHHVAGGRPVGEIWQVLRPGMTFDNAKVIGTDARGDITLLKLQGKGPYPYVELADSDQVQVGDAVVALGNPFGFSKDGSPHVTLGVVSATHRYQGGYSDAIMTDTAINPGNSGGPLLDMHGRLIGINGRIAMRWGSVRANTGVGYAIPANQIKAFIPQFREKGVVRHGAIHGLRLENSNEGGDGALVRSITQTSEAARSGLKAGDVIVEADGRVVTSSQRFEGIVGTLPEGSKLPVVVKRGNERVALELALEPRVGEQQAQRRGGYLGIRMMARQEGDGVEVEEVSPGSPAAGADLQAGDVIQAVATGGPPTTVRTINDLVGVLGKLQPGDKVTITVKRGATTLQKEVALGKWPTGQQ